MMRLAQKSIYIIREAKAQFRNPAVMWSTGKDSTVLLHLCREAFFGEVPFPVIHIDTGWHFPEVYEFRDYLADKWNLDLIVARHPQAGKIKPGKKTTVERCCHKLKTEALRQLIEKEGFDALLVSIRRDEHPLRNPERYVSPRDRNMQWRLPRRKEKAGGDSPFEALQPVELWDIYAADFGEDVHHVRVHPLLHWSEADVWRYIKTRHVPFNPLYRADYVAEHYPRYAGCRFRSIGCMPCTKPLPTTASTLDEIICEVEREGGRERAGRSVNKEAIMRRLRALGYF